MSGKTKTGKHRNIVWFFAAVLVGIFFQKNVPAQAAGVSGYIFPDSAQRYMSEEELYDLPLQIINYGKMRSMRDMAGVFGHRSCRHILTGRAGTVGAFRRMTLMRTA